MIEIGRFLRDVPPLHQSEKPVSFDPVIRESFGELLYAAV